MFLAMVDDIGVVLIKLADRLHNMRTLGAMPPDKQVKIAQQTMEIYAPLANRLGIWPVKSELEDLAFRYLDPEAYQQITQVPGRSASPTGPPISSGSLPTCAMPSARMASRPNCPAEESTSIRSTGRCSRSSATSTRSTTSSACA